MFDDEEQFLWRSECLRMCWGQIVADGDHEIDAVHGGVVSVMGNTNNQVGGLSIVENIVEQVEYPFFEDAENPQPEELELLQMFTYEWCPPLHRRTSERLLVSALSSAQNTHSHTNTCQVRICPRVGC